MKKIICFTIVIAILSISGVLLGSRVYAQTGCGVTPGCVIPNPTSSFDPSQVSVAQGATFSVKIKVTLSQSIIGQGYRIRVNFNKDNLRVTNISYASPWVISLGAGGDGNDTLGTVNSNGFITLLGEAQDPSSGATLAPSTSEFATLTFSATTAVSSNITIDGNLATIYRVNSDFTISPVTIIGSTLPVTVGGVVTSPTPTVTPTPTPPAAGTPFNLTMTPSTATLQCTNNRYTAEAATYRVSWEGEVGTFRVGEVNRQGFFVDIGNQDPGIPLNQIFSDDLGYFHKFITAGTSTNLADFKGFSTKQSNVIIGTDLQFDPDQVYTIRVCSAPGKCSDPIRLTRAHCSVTPTPSPTTAPGVPSSPSIGLLSNQCISGSSETRLSQMTINWTITPVFSGDQRVQISEGNNTFGNPFTKLIPATSFSTTFENFENATTGTPLAIRPDISYFIRVCLQRSGQTCGDPSSPSLRILSCSTTPSPTGAVCTQKPTGDVNVPPNGTDLLDFNIWRDERFGRVLTKTADFNCSGTVDDADFEIWLGGFGG